MTIKVFWISSLVYNEGLCLKTDFFSKSSIFVWVIFWSRFIYVIPVSSFCLYYPVHDVSGTLKFDGKITGWILVMQLGQRICSAALPPTGFAKGSPTEGEGLGREGRMSRWRCRSPQPPQRSVVFPAQSLCGSAAAEPGFAMSNVSWLQAGRRDAWPLAGRRPHCLCHCTPCGQLVPAGFLAGMIWENHLLYVLTFAHHVLEGIALL